MDCIIEFLFATKYFFVAILQVQNIHLTICWWLISLGEPDTIYTIYMHAFPLVKVCLPSFHYRKEARDQSYDCGNGRWGDKVVLLNYVTWFLVQHLTEELEDHKLEYLHQHGPISLTLIQKSLQYKVSILVTSKRKGLILASNHTINWTGFLIDIFTWLEPGSW